MNAPSSNRSYSILLFYTHISLGGAQKLLLDQAQWLHEHGHRVSAAFFYEKENLYEKWSAAHGFPFYKLSELKGDSRGIAWAFHFLTGIWNLWRILRAGKFDAIIAYTHDSNIIGIPLAWLLRVPARIASHHGVIDNFPPWRERFHTWLVNRGIASVLVVVSNKTYKRALEEGINPERLRVIVNGINPVDPAKFDREQIRRELNIPADSLFVLSVGRLTRQKAHDVLVAAVPAMLANLPNITIGICGNGDQRAALEAKIQTLGVGAAVILYGLRHDVERFLAAADIFVLPSRSEGMPLALLEAMSAGLPSVATRVEGVEEALQDGEQGLLVPSEDPDALAGAVLRLAADAGLRQTLGSAARKHVMEHYTADATCTEYMHTILQYLPAESGKVR